MSTINEIVVHAGTFHADDVFCVAMMEIINPNIKVTRTFNVREYDLNADSGTIVADIGGGRFDHHGGPKLRENGSLHCAATLLWERFGADVVRTVAPELDDEGVEIAVKTVDSKLLSTVAAGDNGEINTVLCTVNTVISTFNPNWDEPEMGNRYFAEAVEFSKRIITNEINRSASVTRGKLIVEKAIRESENQVVVLPVFCPWQGAVCATDALVIVFPSQRGGWNIQMVPEKPGSFDTRIKVPDSWKGKSGADAESECPGMSFCHPSGFLCAFTRREDAVNAAYFLTRKEAERNA